MTKARGFIRAAWRLCALALVIVWAVAAYVLNRRNRCDAVGKARWLQHTCRRGLNALAVSIESTGASARGAVIVSNHVSYLDILLLAALTPVVFVSKKEVRSWPIFGWFAEKAGTRFIDRGKRGDVRRIAEEIGPVMKDGLTVVLFLEGTTTDGGHVLPFKSSLLEPVIANGWAVVPAAVSYRVPPGYSVAEEVCWWGDMTLTPHLLNFATLPWIQARAAWGQRSAASGDRKLLAELLHAEVSVLKEGLDGQIKSPKC